MAALGRIEQTFYYSRMRAEYREEPCRVAISHVEGMPFRWSLNPYTGCVHQCTFCYVRAFELRAGRPSDGRYGASIRVKTNLLEVLQRQLKRRSWGREQVAIGTATDPYQPAEGRYRLTRDSIHLLAHYQTPFGIVTRGPLIVRDVDLLTVAAERVDVSVTFSVPTLDERIWRTTEPHTAPPRQRLEALRRLAGAGIHCGVGMAPILPGLSDDPVKLREVVLAAREAGAAHLWWNVVNLRPGTREHFLESLARDWPEQLERYERLYSRSSYLRGDQTKDLNATMNELRSAWVWAPRSEARRPQRVEPPRQLDLKLAS